MIERISSADSVYRDLGDGLVMRTAASDEDVKRVAESHRVAFGEEELEVITLDLLYKNPYIRWDDVLLVEDTRTGQVVSSISLIPRRWAYDKVILQVAELGPVGTRQEYRRRGLIRTQMEVFEQKLQSRGFHLGVIEGIPYFYRQFGYEYALPLGCETRLMLDQIPDLDKGEQELVTIRPLADADIPQAMAFYDVATRGLCLRALRDEATWRYQESLSEASGIHVWSYIVEEDGRPIGYFRTKRHGWDKNIWLCAEVSDLGYGAILTILRFLKRQGQEKGCNQVGLGLHPSAPAMRVARYLGGQERKPYGWQIRIPHRERFFQQIAPVLERRIANSMLAGLTEMLRLNFCEETIELVFRKGRLEKVASLGRTDDEGIRLPPLPAIQLLLGYRSREEISSYRLDFGVRIKFQPIVDVLFPKQESYVYMSA